MKSLVAYYSRTGILSRWGCSTSLLQYLRTYALTHTTNRIDVELGSRLFHHLIRSAGRLFRDAPDRARRSRACASWRPSAAS